jgi:hypothetical protein
VDTLLGWTFRWRDCHCIVDEAGLIVSGGRVAKDPEALVTFFRATGIVVAIRRPDGTLVHLLI